MDNGKFLYLSNIFIDGVAYNRKSHLSPLLYDLLHDHPLGEQGIVLVLAYFLLRSNMSECHLYFQQLPTNAQGVLLPLERYPCLRIIQVERIDSVVEQIYPGLPQNKLDAELSIQLVQQLCSLAPL